jgi:transcriptional regulator with PAS, ATPase and Fis domain
MKVDYSINSSIKSDLRQRKRIGPLKNIVKKYEKEIIDLAIEIHGNLADAAKDLEVDISTLTRKRKNKYISLISL